MNRIWTKLILISNIFLASNLAETTSSTATSTKEKTVQLRGMMEVSQGGESITLIAISEDDTAVSDWLKAGSSWRQYKIVEASAKEGYAVISRSGADQKITLEKQKVSEQKSSQHDSVEPKTEARSLDWRWIASDENPMKKRALDLPPEIVLKWSILSNSEKEKIRDYYRFHGFNLQVDVKPQTIHVDYSRIRNPSIPIDRSKLIPAPKLLQLK